DQRARSLYEQGPGSNLELLFGATSLADLTDRMEFVGAVNAEDSSLADQTQRLADALKIKQARLTVLQTREHRQLTALRARETMMNTKFDQEQSLLADLSSKEQQGASLLSDLGSRQGRIATLV